MKLRKIMLALLATLVLVSPALAKPLIVANRYQLSTL